HPLPDLNRLGQGLVALLVEVSPLTDRAAQAKLEREAGPLRLAWAPARGDLREAIEVDWVRHFERRPPRDRWSATLQDDEHEVQGANAGPGRVEPDTAVTNLGGTLLVESLPDEPVAKRLTPCFRRSKSQGGRP